VGGVTSGEKIRRGTRLAAALLAALALLAAVAGSAGAAAQSLGIHYEETGFSQLYARSDGGLLALRRTGTDARPGKRIESFLPSGAPDPAAPTTDLGQYGSFFPAAGGRTFVLESHKLTRLDLGGSPDPSFGGTGTVKSQYADAVAELGSGKVVTYHVEVLGARSPEVSLRVTVFNSDGSGERTFSLALPPVLSIFTPREIVPLPGGGALVVNTEFLLELNADGSPNTAFGKGGLVDSSGIAGAHVLADGTVETVGYSYDSKGQTENLAVARYTATGAPDTSFGSEGRQVFDPGDYAVGEVAAWAPDGTAYLGGYAHPRGSCSTVFGLCETVPFLAAIDPTGNLATGFGEGGVLKMTAFAGVPGDEAEGVATLVLRPDGTLVAGGATLPHGSVAYLAAFTTAGTPVASFGEGGIVRVREPVPAEERVAGLFALPDGSLSAAATTDVGSAEHPILARYRADGGLDTSFGGGTAEGEGVGFVDVGGGRGAVAAAVKGDEALIGSWEYPRDHLALVHVDDGSPVVGFGPGGSVLLPQDNAIKAVAFAADGDPVVLADRNGPGSTEPGVVFRFRPDGRRDRTFGEGGRLDLKLPDGIEVSGADLLASSGGRLLVGGLTGRGFALTRLLPDGRPDPRFGSHGWVQMKVARRVKSMAVQRVGSKIYLAGTFGDEGGRGVVLARFDLQGHPDKSYGRSGRITAAVEASSPPTAILRTGAGILVALEKGRRPLLTFSADGKVRRRAVGSRPQRVDDVQATLAQGRLVVGWLPYGAQVERPPYHLARLSLRG
jgi:uncharacterized delta-60 repeat protein